MGRRGHSREALVQVQTMTIGELLEHCLKTLYYEPIYESQGRKKRGVRSYKHFTRQIIVALFLMLTINLLPTCKSERGLFVSGDGVPIFEIRRSLAISLI